MSQRPVSVVLIVLELGTSAFTLVSLVTGGSVPASTPVSDLSCRPSYFSFSRDRLSVDRVAGNTDRRTPREPSAIGHLRNRHVNKRVLGNALVVLDQAREGAYKPSGFHSRSPRMDLALRRKDVWIVGSACLISSSLLWRVFQSVMTRGGHRQSPALEETQVVTSLFTKIHFTVLFTVLFPTRERCLPKETECMPRLNPCLRLPPSEGLG